MHILNRFDIKVGHIYYVAFPKWNIEEGWNEVAAHNTAVYSLPRLEQYRFVDQGNPWRIRCPLGTIALVLAKGDDDPASKELARCYRSETTNRFAGEANFYHPCLVTFPNGHSRKLHLSGSCLWNQDPRTELCPTFQEQGLIRGLWTWPGGKVYRGPTTNDPEKVKGLFSK